MRRSPSSALSTGAALGMVLSSNLALAETSIIATTTTDWVYHGVSETRGEPSAGLNLEWIGDDDFFVGLELHDGTTRAERQRERSVMVYAGKDWLISPQWLLNVSVQHRDFPGGAKVWTNNEVEITASFSDRWSLSLDHSPDYYSHGSAASTLELAYAESLGERSYWRSKLGALEHNGGNASDYRYAEIGTGWSTGAINFDLSYLWNSNRRDELFGGDETTSPGLVFSVSVQLR